MDKLFVTEIKDRIRTNLSDINKDMAEVCLAIIEHVSIAPSKRCHLTFLDLYRISPKVNNSDFYDAVFYLTKKNVNVLEEQFEALDPRTGIFSYVSDKEQIIEDMRHEDFYNPFTGENLTEEEFGNQVLTYFTPSKEFLERVNG